MAAGSRKIAPDRCFHEIELFAHNVAALAAAQARHGGGAVAVAKIMESADDKLGCAALPDIARAAYFEGDRQLLQRCLEREPNGACPVKHGCPPRRIARGEKRGYRARRLPRLDFGVRIAPDDDLSRFADGWRVVLVAADLVVADEPLGGLNDLGRGAVVAGERVDAGAVIFRLEIENVPHIGRPERVKRLIVVTDRPKLHAILHKAVDEADLAGIDVLIFVDEQVIEGAGDCAAIAFAAVHGVRYQRNHVREIDGARGLERGFVDAKIDSRFFKDLIVARGALKGGGVEKALFGTTDNVENVLVLVPPHAAGAENLPLFGRVPQGETLLESRRGRIASQLPKGKGMESCDGQPLRGRQLQKPCKARLELIGGLFGVGHYQNAGGIGAFTHQIKEAAGERAGFSGPGPRQGQLDLNGALGGSRLCGIEMAHAWPSDSRTWREYARRLRQA